MSINGNNFKGSKSYKEDVPTCHAYISHNESIINRNCDDVVFTDIKFFNNMRLVQYPYEYQLRVNISATSLWCHQFEIFLIETKRRRDEIGGNMNYEITKQALFNDYRSDMNVTLRFSDLTDIYYDHYVDRFYPKSSRYCPEWLTVITKIKDENPKLFGEDVVRHCYFDEVGEPNCIGYEVDNGPSFYKPELKKPRTKYSDFICETHEEFKNIGFSHVVKFKVETTPDGCEDIMECIDEIKYSVYTRVKESWKDDVIIVEIILLYDHISDLVTIKFNCEEWDVILKTIIAIQR